MIRSKGLKSFGVSGRIIVSDPCYECGEVSVDALPGRWVGRAFTTSADEWGPRVAEVVVHHESWDPTADTSTSTGYIGVDSGQAGVFDADLYELDHDVMYDACCNATLSNSDGHGYVEGGWVTSSGYGDGGYKTRIHRVGGKAVAVEITFIPERSTVRCL